MAKSAGSPPDNESQDTGSTRKAGEALGTAAADNAEGGSKAGKDAGDGAKQSRSGKRAPHVTAFGTRSRRNTEEQANFENALQDFEVDIDSAERRARQEAVATGEAAMVLVDECDEVTEFELEDPDLTEEERAAKEAKAAEQAEVADVAEEADVDPEPAPTRPPSSKQNKAATTEKPSGRQPARAPTGLLGRFAATLRSWFGGS